MGRFMKSGFTLIELMDVIGVFAVLTYTTTIAFTTVMETWGSQDAAIQVREDLRRGTEKMLRDLRLANAISVADDSIRYTVRESGSDNSYIFYLYHPDETWVPDYDESVYELRKATLADIGGTFTYGDGSLYIRDVVPPTTSDLSVSGSLITMDLTTSKYDETSRVLEKLRPRNL